MPRNVSNSEVTTWLSCRLKYYFEFYLNRTPRVTPTPLARGTLGHSAFEEYAKARLAGKSHSDSLAESMGVFTSALTELDISVVLETKYLYERYMAFHKGWPEWEILGTEERKDLGLTDELVMTMRYDLLVREVATNRVLLVDFKFSYEFWRPLEHDLNAQAPKYIVVMNNNGIRVDGAVLEEIRTRKVKEDDHKKLWRRTFYFPSVQKKRNVVKQHILAAKEIEEYRNLSDEQRELASIPVLNKHGACKFCNFDEICATKLSGEDYTMMLETNFVENTYGYNQQTESPEEII